jgi:hypothetical protein
MLAAITLALGMAIGADPAGDLPPDPFANLPEGWSIANSVEVPAAQTAAIGKKLGGDVVGLSNTTLSVHGQPLKVNIIRCRGKADAQRVYQSLLKIKGSPQAALLRDASVVEFVAGDIRLAIRAHYALGFKPRQASYRVSFSAAPLVKCDYMRWNRLFNACLALDLAVGDDRERAELAIAELLPGFTFGNELRLRRFGQGAKATRWAFDPQPEPDAALVDTVLADASRTYVFDRLPEEAGVPRVRVTGDIDCEAFARLPDPSVDTRPLLAATEFWPVQADEISILAAQITAGYDTPRERIDAILEWLIPGKHVRYAGNVTGSRYGVQQVVKQGYGHCWDFSDVFVTLCRASGVPARQVGGWLVGQGGHVWAEAMTDEQVWEAFDPTVGMGCGSDYVPIITTADGQWPLAYATEVRIEAIEGH